MCATHAAYAQNHKTYGVHALKPVQLLRFIRFPRTPRTISTLCMFLYLSYIKTILLDSQFNWLTEWGGYVYLKLIRILHVHFVNVLFNMILLVQLKSIGMGEIFVFDLIYNL